MDKEKQKKKQVVKSKGNDLLKTVIATGIAGLIILLLVIVILSKALGGNKDKTVDKDKSNGQNVTSENDMDREMVKITGVITKIDDKNKKVTLMEVETEEPVDIMLGNTTQIIDEYGKPLTFHELTIGEIIYTKYNQVNKEPEFFRISSEAWEYKTSDIQLDTEKQSLNRGNETYQYTDNLIAMYNGQPFDIAKLTEVDEVVIRGYKDKLCSLELVNSHGFVKLKNYEFFLGAILTVDRDKTIIIEEAMDNLLISEGKHKVVIEKKEYEPYIKEIMVMPDEVVTVDLGEFQLKRGEIQFKSNVANVKIYIDDKLITDTKEALSLDYGEYPLKIMLDEEIIKEEKLIVNKPYRVYNINVEQKGEEERQIHINTDPIGVEVYINNQLYGFTPLSITLDPGNYKVLLIKEGYETGEYDILVNDGEEDLFFTFPSMDKLGSGKNNNTNNNPKENGSVDHSYEDDDFDEWDLPSTPIDDVYNP